MLQILINELQFRELESPNKSYCRCNINKHLVMKFGYIKINLDLTHVNPARMLRRLLLPAPEGPMIAVNSPELKHPSIPCNISFLAEIKSK